MSDQKNNYSSSNPQRLKSLMPHNGAHPPPLGRLSTGPRIPKRDKIIQSTDIDALSSKYSAYMKGYLHDPFLQDIVDGIKQHSSPRERVASSFIAKLPVINIGTYFSYFLNLGITLTCHIIFKEVTYGTM